MSTASDADTTTTTAQDSDDDIPRLPKMKKYRNKKHKSADQMLRNALELPDASDEANRRNALKALETILNQWAKELVVTEQQDHVVALIPFGSYRLCVHQAFSDLDVLCLAPSTITRQEFFTGFVQRLKTSTYAANVITHVHPIPTAYTPVIKMKVLGMDVDLVFGATTNVNKLRKYLQHKHNSNNGNGNFDSSQESDYYTIDDTDLKGQDEAGLRSLNGARVCQILLQTAQHNIETFRTTLRFVKQFAVQRGIYSNVTGFLGGINWAILVAWCQQQSPDCDRPTLLIKLFFDTSGSWKWPAPVMLAPIQVAPPDDCPALPVWNARNNNNTNTNTVRELMPILTPAYPAMNSAYNVGLAQFRRVQDELRRARGVHPLSLLLELPTPFFYQHEHFLQVTVSSGDNDNVAWLKFVESRLRVLISSLETDQVQVWPFARWFELGKSRHAWFMALRFSSAAPVDLRHLASDFVWQVNNWSQRTKDMDVALAHVLAQDLPTAVVEAACMAPSYSSQQQQPRLENDSNSRLPKESEPSVVTSPTKRVRRMQAAVVK
jgi:poly(A) polymerase